MTEQNTTMAKWMLPDGIEETLPVQASVLEQLRRRLLDHFSCCGYDLIMTPFIEYLDVLLAGSGRELDLQTFKVTDSLSGRQMGLRADMTLQAARIDAHQIQQDGPVRLCYLATVLRTVKTGFAGSRTPLQVGAELYGHAGLESDFEILELMLDTLRLAGVADVHIDLGHVGIFRGLIEQADLDAAQEQAIFDALQRKAIPEINTLVDSMSLDDDMSRWLRVLADLNGGPDTLRRAQQELSGASEKVHKALEDMMQVADAILERHPGLSVHYDLAELRGYAYQTGLVFAAFVPGYGEEIARGGRYDDIGRIFGRARPATGFSADLKMLIQLSSLLPAHAQSGIFAPAVREESLREAVHELREQGERVVYALPGQQGDASDMGCDRQLCQEDGKWQIVTVTK